MSRLTRSSALVVALGALGCTPDGPSRRAREPGDVAVWDLPPPADPKTTLPLWPARPGTPARLRRHVAAQEEQGRLVAVVDGVDPHLLWRLESPIAASSVSVTLDATQPGELQLFWSSARCPVFSEACSVRRGVGPREGQVTFFLDRGELVREVRLDLPDRAGARLSFREVTVHRDPEVSSPWVVAGSEAPEPEMTQLGLRVEALQRDPWIITPTAGLDAAWVDAVELTLRGPGGPPQLYWDTACGPGFTEECSAPFSPADAGALTHRVDLRKSPRWRGSIATLRLDPGPGPGTYLIERVALVRTSAP